MLHSHRNSRFRIFYHFIVYGLNWMRSGGVWNGRQKFERSWECQESGPRRPEDWLGMPQRLMECMRSGLESLKKFLEFLVCYLSWLSPLSWVETATALIKSSKILSQHFCTHLYKWKKNILEPRKPISKDLLTVSLSISTQHDYALKQSMYCVGDEWSSTWEIIYDGKIF